MSVPQDWQTPTFSDLAEPVPMFGLRPGHLIYVVIPPGLVFLVLLFVQTITHSIITWLVAFTLPIAIAVVVRAVFVHLCKQDKHWLEHQTTHYYPQVRWQGK